MNYSLQIARGIAAVIVSFHHLFLGPYFKIYPDSILKSTHINLLGGLAVYFFFALSGYVLTLSINKKSKDARTFLKERVIRIYPEYILWTLSAYFLWLFLGREWIHLNYTPSGFSDWFHTLSLIPPILYSDSFATLLSVAWSLVYEMYFYVLFALLLFFIRDKEKYINISILMFFIFFVLHITLNGNFNIQKYKWVHIPYILSDFISVTFALGSLLFYARIVSFKKNFLPFSLILLLLIVLVFSKKNLASSYNLVVLSTIILYLTLSIKINSDLGKKFSFIGDASYTIYLVHVIFSKVAWKITDAGVLFLFNILVIIIGCLLYIFVSKPITLFIKSKC